MLIHRSGVRATVAALCLCLFCPGGCAKPDKLVHENFSQIRKGASTRADVQAILGDPDQRLGDDQWIYQRPDKHLHVFIDFDEKGHVSRTQWIDGMEEVWHDTKDSSKDRTENPPPAGSTSRKVTTSSGG